MQPPDTAREEPLSAHELFLSERWKRHQKKRCLVSASLRNSKHFKGKEKGELASWKCKECGCPSCVVSPAISIFYLPFRCQTRGLCVVWFRNMMPTVFSLGFYCCKRKLKLDNEKQWKIYLNWKQEHSSFLCQGCMTSIGISYLVISFALYWATPESTEVHHTEHDMILLN